MIDLEVALSAFVERAPDPPEVGSVRRRARQRQWRRRATAITSALMVLVAGVAGAIAIDSSGRSTHAPIATPGTDHVRLTLPDGSQLEVSGPESLGLTTLAPEFNAELDPTTVPAYGVGHSFSIQHTTPAEPGPVVGRYPTADGHELVVSKTQLGVDAVVVYENWTLVAPWGLDPTDWARWAAALDAKETADGFLVFEPVDASWRIGSTDAPDAQFGSGNRAALQFFDPSTYPQGCPEASQTNEHTAEGWPAAVYRRAAWCDDNAHVRVWVTQPHLFTAALEGLRVSYTDAGHELQRVTTLRGASFEITAPSTVLDQLFLQASVSVDGIDEPNILNTTPNELPVSATRGGLPAGAAEPSFATGDGHRLYSYRLPTECQCEVLAGTYSQWLVEIEVDGMAVADRTRVASLFSAHETPDGFLVLDPTSPMRLAPGPQDIVLDGAYVSDGASTRCPSDSIEAHTPEGFGVHIVGKNSSWCDPIARVAIDVLDDPTHALVGKIHVRRVDPG